jgi:hypothetical protein
MSNAVSIADVKQAGDGKLGPGLNSNMDQIVKRDQQAPDEPTSRDDEDQRRTSNGNELR